MENQELDRLSQKVLSRICVELEASGRHVHVTREQAQILFGHDLTPQRELSQPGQFLSRERVTIVGPKGEFQNVAVLGPARDEGQVEISLSDGRVLGITPPVRLSGDVKNSPPICIKGPCGEVTLSQGVIAAKRHIHMTPADAARFGVSDKQVVSLSVYTARPLIFEDVVVRVSDKFCTRVHLDYDEANACGFSQGDWGRIVL